MTAADTQIQEVEKMFSVNVFGTMRMVHYFHRLLIAAQSIIVNIESVGGIVPYVYGGIAPSPIQPITKKELPTQLTHHDHHKASYNASKAAPHQYGDTLRFEMKLLGSVSSPP